MINILLKFIHLTSAIDLLDMKFRIINMKLRIFIL
jgi:hypothetical protein